MNHARFTRSTGFSWNLKNITLNSPSALSLPFLLRPKSTPNLKIDRINLGGEIPTRAYYMQSLLLAQ
uniref:Uncharacterized protein n=1 Tax=Nelumbo nucifera TaxID=4432 RepID=A0A822Z2E4_NELNU|nr:TPA_asm: hypothetical protein HUJ06_007797 [Nelumbo nucifera]